MDIYYAPAGRSIAGRQLSNLINGLDLVAAVGPNDCGRHNLPIRE